MPWRGRASSAGELADREVPAPLPRAGSACRCAEAAGGVEGRDPLRCLHAGALRPKGRGMQALPAGICAGGAGRRPSGLVKPRHSGTIPAGRCRLQRGLGLFIPCAKMDGRLESRGWQGGRQAVFGRRRRRPLRQSCPSRCIPVRLAVLAPRLCIAATA